jgi:hypothetical protein
METIHLQVIVLTIHGSNSLGTTTMLHRLSGSYLEVYEFWDGETSHRPPQTPSSPQKPKNFQQHPSIQGSTRTPLDAKNQGNSMVLMSVMELRALEGFTDDNRFPTPLNSKPTIESQSPMESLSLLAVSGAVVSVSDRRS